MAAVVSETLLGEHECWKELSREVVIEMVRKNHTCGLSIMTSLMYLAELSSYVALPLSSAPDVETVEIAFSDDID